MISGDTIAYLKYVGKIPSVSDILIRLIIGMIRTFLGKCSFLEIVSLKDLLLASDMSLLQ